MFPIIPPRRRIAGALALALLLAGCASPAPRAPARPAPDTLGRGPAVERAAERGPAIEDQSVDMETAGFDAMAYAPAPAPGVRELRDGELSCAELYAETEALARSGREQQARIDQAQAAMEASQAEMMKQAGSARRGGGVGAGLLSMVPGASMVTGIAAQAAASARAKAMQENSSKMMQTQMQMIEAEQALEYTRARNDHLAGLFLDKGCKLSEIEGAQR